MIERLKPYAEYKESGLPWTGQLPKHWSIKRGKALFSESHLPVRAEDEIVTCFRDGQVTLRKNRRTSGFMVALYEAGYQGVRKGHLVIHAMDAFAGAIGMSDSDGKCTPEYIVANPRSRSAEPRYFARLLRFAAHQGYIHVSCPAVRERAPRFRYAHFGDMLMPLPPPGEQAAIVRFLDHANRRIDGFIRAKRKLIGLLNEQKQAIIHRAVTRGLHPDVPLKPSGIPWLGDIPKHWEVRRLKNALRGRLANGLFKRGDDFGSGVLLVNVSDVYDPEGLVRTEKLARVRCSAEELSTFRVVAGDMFFVRSSLKLEGTGRCALIQTVSENAVFECHLVRGRPDGRIIDPNFLSMFLRSWAGTNNIVARANTVTISTVDQGAISSLPVVVPPLVEQAELLKLVATETAPISAAIARTEREITLMQEYRTSLTADLVTGKLDARTAAEKLPTPEDETLPSDTIDPADAESEEE